MTQHEFVEQMDAWLADVKDGAVDAYQKGCAPERCLQIGTMFADARNVERVRKRAGSVVVAPALMPSNKQLQ